MSLYYVMLYRFHNSTTRHLIRPILRWSHTLFQVSIQSPDRRALHVVLAYL